MKVTITDWLVHCCGQMSFCLKGYTHTVGYFRLACSICCVNSVTYWEGSHTKTRSLGEGLMPKPGPMGRVWCEDKVLAGGVSDTSDSPGPGLCIRPSPRDWLFFCFLFFVEVLIEINKYGACVTSPMTGYQQRTSPKFVAKQWPASAVFVQDSVPWQLSNVLQCTDIIIAISTY